MANSPINTIKPSISGIYTVGQTLTCSTGTWTGDPTISYSYQWKRDITNIGTNTNSYLLISADTNNPIYCVVTATNTVGSNSAYSDLPITSTFSTAGSSTITGLSQTTVYAFTVAAVNAIGQGPSSARSINIYTPTIPLNTVAPSISGTSTVRGALTCTTGTWTSSLTITYSYQWKKGITDIGTNTNTYSPVLADFGVANITCIVTATSTAGAAYSTSNTIANITATTALAPSIGTVTRTSNTVVSIPFTAPTDTGGAAITSYSIISTPSIALTYSGTTSPMAVTGTFVTGTSYTFTIAAINSIGTGTASSSSNSVIPYAIAAGQALFTTVGTSTWTPPLGVTSVCVVCVGGGGGGVIYTYDTGTGFYAMNGGAGGGLGWKNNIAVAYGTSYTVVVGVGGPCGIYYTGSYYSGGDSYFINATTVKGGGGAGGRYNVAVANSTFVGDGGGAGGGVKAGDGAGSGLGPAGGGGAGGYSGTGGLGGFNNASYNPTAGAGGGGGGGGNNAQKIGYGGGGVGIFGQGASGGFGAGRGGNGGSGGTPVGIITAKIGGTYGGGGGGNDEVAGVGGAGSPGAVRIIWGPGRAFPSTLTTDQ